MNIQKLIGKMKIVIGCDHAAFDVKNLVMKYLSKKNISYIDVGCHDEKSVDYPDIASEAALKIQNKEVGILIFII